MKTILLALGFMAIFEGLMPLISPESWQEALRRIAAMDPAAIRRFAMIVVVIGLAVVWGVMSLV